MSYYFRCAVPSLSAVRGQNRWSKTAWSARRRGRTTPPRRCTSSMTCKLYKSIIIGLISITEPPWSCLSSRRRTWTAPRPGLDARLLPNLSQIYLAQDIHIVIVIFITLFILIAKNYILLPLLDSWLEDFVRPGVLLSPAVTLIFVLEIVVADIRISIGDADIDTFVLENSRDLLQHFLRVLLGVTPAPT